MFGIFKGSDTHILDVGSKMAATIVSATEEIADGVLDAPRDARQASIMADESLHPKRCGNVTEGLFDSLARAANHW